MISYQYFLFAGVLSPVECETFKIAVGGTLADRPRPGMLAWVFVNQVWPGLIPGQIHPLRMLSSSVGRRVTLHAVRAVMMQRRSSWVQSNVNSGPFETCTRDGRPVRVAFNAVCTLTFSSDLSTEDC